LLLVRPYLAAEEFHQSSDVEARHRLRCASTSLLGVWRTRRSTIGDWAFPVASSRLWNSLLLPVPSVAPERIRKWWPHVQRKAPEKFLSCLSALLALQVQIVVSAFVMVSTLWPVSCLPSHIVKLGARAPVPYGVGAGECP